MTKVRHSMELFAYKFYAQFFRGDDQIPDEGVGFFSIEHTPHGLMFRAAHRAGEPTLFRRIGEAERVKIVLLSRDPSEPSRVIHYGLARAKSLPVQLLNAAARSTDVALDCVLFESVVVAAVKDEVIPAEVRNDPFGKFPVEEGQDG